MEVYDKRNDQGIFSDVISAAVEKALCDGWVITHKGYLVWTLLPRAYLRFVLRGFILVLEAVFTMVFWMMVSHKKDYCMPHLCPWAIDTFTYDGCCTHFSINEGGWVGAEEAQRYEGYTPDEIDVLDLEYKKTKQRQYTVNKGDKHKDCTKAYSLKHLALGSFKCDVCDLTFRSPAKLLEHEGREIHKRKAAGLGRRNAGRGGGQRALRDGRYQCKICNNMNFPSADRLRIHLGGVRHAKKLRDLGLSPALT
jgi:hypothetical protein